MTAGDTLRFAAEGIRRAPLRAVLTASGVAVAVTVLTLLVGIGAGVQRVITEIVATEELLTTVKVFSRHDPRWGRAPERAAADPDDPDEGLVPITEDLVARLARAPGVRAAHRDVIALAAAERADGFAAKPRAAWERRTTLLGLWPDALPLDAATRLAEGRLPRPDEPDALVASSELARLLRGPDGTSPLGAEVVFHVASREGAGGSLAPLRARVVGVLRPRERLADLLSTLTPTGMGTQRIAYLWAPGLEAAAGDAFRGLADLLPGGAPPLPPGATSAASLHLANPSHAAAVRHAVEAEGLRALYAGDLLQRLQVIFAIADGILVGLGGVALVVSALGIVNTMLMAVIERTREIGVLKALGARDATIAWLFWCEAGWLGLAGGAAGAALGLGLGEATSALVNGQFIVPRLGPEAAVDLYAFPPWLWGGALGVAMAVAWLAALYPARRAARIDPVRALRYE